MSDFFINGPALVSVKGRSGSGISVLSELGLTEGPIRVTPNIRHADIAVNAWGNGHVPPEVQIFAADVTISMALVWFNRDILGYCFSESCGVASGVEGQLAGTGARLGNNSARFSTTNFYISLNITSPNAAVPWRFPSCYMTGPPMEFPLGTERSVVPVNWRCIPYTTNPYNGGLSTLNYVLFDHTLDT